MEYDDDTIEHDPEPISVMQARFGKALDGVYDAESPAYKAPNERTPGDIRRHTFDFPDGMRLMVSKHSGLMLSKHSDTVIHAWADWRTEDERPAERTEALWQMAERLDTLIEGLPGVGEAPPPLDYGMSENEVPHLFYPYPDPAYGGPHHE